MGYRNEEILEQHHITSGIVSSSNLDTFDLNSLNLANIQTRSLDNQYGINSDMISVPYSAANIDIAKIYACERKSGWLTLQLKSLSKDQAQLQMKNCTQNNINYFLGKLDHAALKAISQKWNCSSISNVDEIQEEVSLLQPVDAKLFQTVARSGLRGLKVLSLAECRNFSDAGIESLSQLQFLEKLNLLWCTKIEDEGLNLIAKQFELIKDLNLGGTNVSANGLRDMVGKCEYLTRVSIMGCKKLNHSDDQILLRKQIQCEGVDDVFRFQLQPDVCSNDLPPITKSVLKTRSTLSLNKVYKYLFKRLNQIKIDDLIRNEADPTQVLSEASIDAIVPEEKIEIMCNGHYLKSTLQLNEVRSKYWFENHLNPQPDLMILHYRRKLTVREKVQIELDKLSLKQDLCEKLVRAALPVPSHLSLHCMGCRHQIEHFLMVKQHLNCQQCGNVFCVTCCGNEVAVQQGQVVKVCDSCLQILKV